MIVVLVVGDGRTALHVEQRVVPGVADLAGEQTERVDLGAVAIGSEHVADIVAAEIGPVALRFNAEHDRTLLPAIADLATDGAAGRVVAAFRRPPTRSQLLWLVPPPPLIPM